MSCQASDGELSLPAVCGTTGEFVDSPVDYKDHCLIIVGDGGEADEVLARRRWATGGRLAHFRVQDWQGQVVVEGEEDEVICAWQPCYDFEVSTLGGKLEPSFKTYWTKSGPDCIEVKPGQSLHVTSCQQRLRHVRYMDEGGQIKAEMSGEVVLRPDLHCASNLDVEVRNPELQACGTYSWRYVLLGLALQLALYIFRWSISILCERSAEQGDYAWWRGPLCLMNLSNIWGLLEMWSASLSGEESYGWTLAIFCCFNMIWVVLCLNGLQLNDLIVCWTGLLVLLVTGPTIQFVRSRSKHVERSFLRCFAWTMAQLFGTMGVSVVLASLVVAYRLLLANGWTVSAAFFLPCSTALVESGMVAFAKFAYTRLVIEQRPQVPGDISKVAMPYMLTSAHAFSEGARMVAVFSGAVTGGGYDWIGSLAVTLCLNVMARTGWTRFMLYCVVKKTLGVRRALMLAPSAWSKLHDEIKIYAGYFRFVVLISLVIARALVHQQLTLDGPLAPAFNTSAAWALLGLLVLEYVEDHIVLRQVVPMSPVLGEMIDFHTQRGGSKKHHNLISVELRKSSDGTNDRHSWRLGELNEQGFRSSSQHLPVMKEQRSAPKFSAVLPCPDDLEDPALATPGTSATSAHRSSTIEDMVRPVERAGTEAEKVLRRCPSMGPARSASLSSRLRRSLGQPREVNPALLLHGLRSMSWGAQLSAIGITCEVTLGFLNITLGPGFVRGVAPACGTFDALVMLWWPLPMTC